MDTSTELTGIEQIAVNGYQLSHYIGIFLGSIMFMIGIKKLIEYSKNPNDPRNGLGSVLVMMIGASMLWSLQSSISLMTNTLSNNNHCFVMSKNSEDIGNSINKHDGECFNAKNSEITQDLSSKLEKDGKTASLEILTRKINVFVKVLQTVGLIFFIKSIFLLKSCAEGSSGVTYGKVLTMLIASSLVLDMPNTLQMIINTAKEVSAL